MKPVRIIPCLDVKNGRVVKGIKFKGLRDVGDPVEVGARYDSEGADELAFLDITATVEKRSTMVEVVKKVSAKVSIPLTVGGGISSMEGAKELFEAGVDKVSINTAGVLNHDIIRQIASEFGTQSVIAAIDARRSNSTFEVYTDSGTKATGLNAVDWAKKVCELGAGEILLTSMDRDGTKDGYDLELTLAISQAVNVPVIASGGAGNLEHLYEVIANSKADAVLAASIFHYGEYTIKEAKQYLQKKGIPVNL